MKGFFAKTDEVAARIALSLAEDTFETSSRNVDQSDDKIAEQGKDQD